jgi:hypothetical protein
MCVCVCVCVPSFELFNQFPDFNEIFYEHDATGGHSNHIHFIFCNISIVNAQI